MNRTPEPGSMKIAQVRSEYFRIKLSLRAAKGIWNHPSKLVQYDPVVIEHADKRTNGRVGPQCIFSCIYVKMHKPYENRRCDRSRRLKEGHSQAFPTKLEW